MADRRIFPTNFFVWPSVRDLVPDVKLLLACVWLNPLSGSLGNCPAGILENLAASTNLSRESILDQLPELERRGLVVFDSATGEIFAMSWFRFHKFSGPIRAGLHREFAKILSDKIKKAVLSEAQKSQPDLLSAINGAKPPPRPRAASGAREAATPAPSRYTYAVEAARLSPPKGMG